MKRVLIALAALGLFGAPSAQAGMHGHKAHNTNSGTIVDAAVATPSLSTLVAAVKAADLVGTLSSTGPFTVFAPTNDAFGQLPDGTVGTLLKPENKRALTGVLTYHVVAGAFDSRAILGLVKKGRGVAKIKTVQGELLTVRRSGASLGITDAKGNTSRVAIANLRQSNGIVHVIDGVLLPN